MMIGSMRKYSITYKQNEQNFDIYQRKRLHNLRVQVNDGNFEGSKSIEIVSSNLICVSHIDKVLILDNETYVEVGTLPIKLLPTTTREPNLVIGIEKSEDEEWIAVISGKNLVMDEQKQNQLFVFKKIHSKSDFEYDSYSLDRRIVIKDIPIFERVCMEYHFKRPHNKGVIDSIIFVKPD
jgi:hypothetical protein